MKKILLPTDFSDNAQKAIDYALYLFEKETCTFYLVHAYYNAPSAPGTKMTAKEDLKQLAKSLEAKSNGKHRFETILETDSVINVVNRTVIDKDVDFVFMGTKGSSALREIFIGGNTTDVLKYLVGCPVVTVPDGYVYDLPDEIVFATDFKHRFEKHELVPLTTIAKLWNSKLTIVHIRIGKELDESQLQNKELLENNLNPIQSKIEIISMEDTIASTLRNFERENPDIGMVALLRTKHGFFQKLLREPVVRKMAFQTKVPLLVFPLIE